MGQLVVVVNTYQVRFLNKNMNASRPSECSVRCPCMAINVSVQYNGGLLPDIILLT